MARSWHEFDEDEIQTEEVQVFVDSTRPTPEWEAERAKRSALIDGIPERTPSDAAQADQASKVVREQRLAELECEYQARLAQPLPYKFYCYETGQKFRTVDEIKAMIGTRASRDYILRRIREGLTLHGLHFCYIGAKPDFTYRGFGKRIRAWRLMSGRGPRRAWLGVWHDAAAAGKALGVKPPTVRQSIRIGRPVVKAGIVFEWISEDEYERERRTASAARAIAG